MSEKVYCENCRKYYPDGIGTGEGCYAIERGESYKSKDGIIYMKPAERNKNNDCRLYDKNEN